MEKRKKDKAKEAGRMPDEKKDDCGCGCLPLKKRDKKKG